MLQAMTTMESEIMLWVQEYLRRDWLDPIWIAVTTLGNGGMIWILLSVGLLIPKKNKKNRNAGTSCAGIFLSDQQSVVEKSHSKDEAL